MLLKPFYENNTSKENYYGLYKSARKGRRRKYSELLEGEIL